MIGDAAHACPPLVAQGAAICAEEAVVLAELVTDLSVEQALSAFMARRMPRVMNETLGFLAASEA